MAFLLAMQAAGAAGLVCCKRYGVVSYWGETESGVGRPENGYRGYSQGRGNMHKPGVVRNQATTFTD